MRDESLEEIGSVGPLEFLQIWYQSGCVPELHDGGGISIEAVDGPAWWVKIDLRDTALEGCCTVPAVREREDGAWLQTWCDGDFFTVATGATALLEGLAEFRRFVLCNDQELWEKVVEG